MNNPEYVKIEDKKYKINTSFIIAIECNKICTDKTIGDTERAMAIIYKLFGDEGLNHPEHYDKLIKLALKYLSLDKPIETDNDEKPDMDFEQDMDYIITSFKSDYNIDLTKDMHWWTFMNLINGLSNSEFGNCCVLNRIRNLRNYDVSTIKDSKERQKIIKAKEQVALKKNKKENHLTKEQEESMERLNKILGL